MGLDSSYLDNTSQLCPVWFCLPFFLNTVVQIRKDIDGVDVCEGVQSPFVNVVRTLTTSRRQHAFLCFPTRGLQNRMPQAETWRDKACLTGCVGRSYQVCGEVVLQGGTGCVGRSYRVCGEVLQGDRVCVEVLQGVWGGPTGWDRVCGGGPTGWDMRKNLMAPSRTGRSSFLTPWWSWCFLLLSVPLSVSKMLFLEGHNYSVIVEEGSS